MSKVFIVIPDDYAAGGLQRSALAIRSALQDSDHTVHIKCIKLCNHGYAQKYSFFTRVSPSLASKYLFWICFCYRMLVLLYANPGAIFISMGLFPCISLALLSFGPKRWRLIGSERIYPPMESHGIHMELARRLLFHRFHFIVAQSSRTLDWYSTELSIPRHKLVLIPNSVERQLDTPADCEKTVFAACRNAPPTDRPPTVACVGRLTPQKGFDYALHVFSDIASKVNNARFLIVGEGPLRDDLIKAALRLHLSPGQIFCGPVEDLSVVWRNCDVFFLPSRYEGFPNVLAEAMAHGLPSVAFDCPTGPADLIEHSANGFLCAVGDIEKASKYIVTLLRSPSLRRQLGREAMNVSSRFSTDKVGSKWVEIVSSSFPNLL